MFHSLEHSAPGNQHISLVNRIKDYDPVGATKAKLDIQYLRSVYQFNISTTPNEPLDHIYKAKDLLTNVLINFNKI